MTISESLSDFKLIIFSCILSFHIISRFNRINNNCTYTVTHFSPDCGTYESFSQFSRKSFTEERFPRNMKLNKLIPTFKKGDKEDLNNYRPIAMSSSGLKIYKKIFLNRLENHLNNYVSSQQHGFQKGKSTLTALYDFVEIVYHSLEAREKLNVILYDFSDAFGTLYPPLLLRKLKIYGLCDKALSWLQSFLTQREQYVQLET